MPKRNKERRRSVTFTPIWRRHITPRTTDTIFRKLNKCSKCTYYYYIMTCPISPIHSSADFIGVPHQPASFQLFSLYSVTFKRDSCWILGPKRLRCVKLNGHAINHAFHQFSKKFTSVWAETAQSKGIFLRKRKKEITLNAANFQQHMNFLYIFFQGKKNFNELTRNLPKYTESCLPA